MGILQAVLLANALGARHPENEVSEQELNIEGLGFESQALSHVLIKQGFE